MQAYEPVLSISSPLFLEMIRSGAEEIITNELVMNSMNVFPVTDHDTGSNMAALMRMILSQSYSTDELPVLLKQVADASLLGACGNSGMIFSAFFVGLSSNHLFKNEFTKDDFINSIKLGVKRAYKAVAKPVEGTILTVMTAWSEACADAFQETNDFIEIFKASIQKAEEMLTKTKNQLLVLEKNHVVDAGAYGFVKFINGMYEYLVNPDKEKKLEIVFRDQEASIDHWHEGASNYQYCMETLLFSPKQDAVYLEQTLKSYGDSIVLNKSATYLKVHMHTTNVKKVTELLKEYGTIQHQKIDDMKKQWKISKSRKFSVALVTDSSADIPANWVDEYQIHVVPVQVRMGAHILQDKLSVDLHSLDHLKPGEIEIGTSSPSPESISRYLKFLALHYDSIIVITISSNLSSTYQMMVNQKDSLDAKIDIVDSRVFSTAQGLLVMQAAKYIALGLTHDAILVKVNELINKTKFFATIDETKSIIQSGRAPSAMRFLVDCLGLKPVISIKEGKTSILAVGLGRLGGWRRIISKIKGYRKRTGVASIAVIHTCGIEKARAFSDYVEKKLGLKVDYIEEGSCAVALHAGRSYLGIAICSEGLPPLLFSKQNEDDDTVQQQASVENGA